MHWLEHLERYHSDKVNISLNLLMDFKDLFVELTVPFHVNR